MADINIYGKLVNQLEDGRLADTTQIYDPTLHKFQSEINAAEAIAVAAAVVSGDYDTTTHNIRLFNSAGTVVSTIDATPFIKDGMVSSVVVSNGYLVITFNTDAGKQPISIPLTDIFNPNNYYTKQEVDANKVAKVSTANKIYGTDSNGAQTTYDTTALGAEIDDTATSLVKTWSSSKINGLVSGLASRLSDLEDALDLDAVDEEQVPL